MSYGANHVATLACIKRVPVIDSIRPLESQLLMLNLFGPANSDSALSASPAAAATAGTEDKKNPASNSNPYATLHSLLHLAVAPYFDAYVNSKATSASKRSQLEAASGGTTSKGNKDNEAKTGIPAAKKRFAELELSLLHLQQNVEVPDISLSVHPLVQRAVDRCHAEGLRVSPEALDQGLIHDTSFLNRVQSEVNSWIKEIQNVTKLSREVSSGTASQEINFWLTMERALEDIEEQLKSEPITLTLDILRYAKRFQATVSFVADTGLKEATDVVHKYNQLMKDFPLNELLAATDLDKIQEAVLLIFGHLNKKLKLSPYPVRRALPLVEAISRDLNDQLLRVLGSLRLMYLEYEAFDRAMKSATSVFQAWDESIKEFTNVARDVTRKRSEKFIPIKINPAHAKLQSRVLYLRQFRKQHDQLRHMISPTKGLISSMLQPAGQQQQQIQEITAQDGAVDRRAARGLTDFDMEEEVRLAYETVKTVDVLDVSTGSSGTA